ncbi:unnamed protein product [Adineta steineri]|uniref:Small lysine-rich protein 1 n=1 Tax=Adineta steineri TaxID=433720 RepID=A0A818HJ43_9BILA|nr:unnamed protein product [Adineta steineri]CAF3509273.1 unnamed protein product [Adineta steineri]
MPGKKKKGKATKKKGDGSASGSPKKKGKSKSKKVAEVRPEIDILSPAAVINSYYICHDVTDCLTARGFGWEGAKKKGKKKGKKKK